MRYTVRHCGKAVIKNKASISEALEKLAKIEDAEEEGTEYVRKFVRCSECDYLVKERCTGEYWCRNSQGLEFNLTPYDGCTRGRKKHG